MAIMNITYLSYSLTRYVDFKVILPIEDTKTFEANPKDKPKEFKTLYLLHGFSGSCGDWLYGSRIYKLARDYNLAVVMPSGENSFYTDGEDGGALYGTFVGKELVEATRKIFPLSKKREDTFIGGLSMGGFGSLLVGSRFAENFGAIISLSGGFFLEDLFKDDKPDYLKNTPNGYYKHAFGDLETVMNSERDPFAMAVKAHKEGTLPPIYMACGTEDFVFENNVQMKDSLLHAGIKLHWEQAPGEHEWTFWDPYIEKAIDWCLKNK